MTRLECVDREWRKQVIEETDTLISEFSYLEFWRDHMSGRNIQGERKHPSLQIIVGCLMPLPHANAPVKRLCRALILIKPN